MNSSVDSEIQFLAETRQPNEELTDEQKSPTRVSRPVRDLRLVERTERAETRGYRGQAHIMAASTVAEFRTCGTAHSMERRASKALKGDLSTSAAVFLPLGFTLFWSGNVRPTSNV